MKKSVLLLCCLAIFWGFAGTGFAENSLKMHVIQASPIGFTDENGDPTGYHWDYLSAIETRSGVSMELFLTPYTRLWKSLKKGDHDGGIVYRSADRDDIVEYVAPIAERENIVIPKKGITLKSYDDLYQLKTIGTMQDLRLGDRFDADEKLQAKLQFAYDYDTLVKMLLQDRYEAIAGNSVALAYLLDKHDAVDAIALPGVVVGKRVEWLQFSKKSPHLDKLPALKKAIESLKAEGFFRQVLKKYISDEKMLKIVH